MDNLNDFANLTSSVREQAAANKAEAEERSSSLEAHIRQYTDPFGDSLMIDASKDIISKGTIRVAKSLGVDTKALEDLGETYNKAGARGLANKLIAKGTDRAGEVFDDGRARLSDAVQGIQNRASNKLLQPDKIPKRVRFSEAPPEVREFEVDTPMRMKTKSLKIKPLTDEEKKVNPRFNFENRIQELPRENQAKIRDEYETMRFNPEDEDDAETRNIHNNEVLDVLTRTEEQDVNRQQQIAQREATRQQAANEAEEERLGFGFPDASRDLDDVSPRINIAKGVANEGGAIHEQVEQAGASTEDFVARTRAAVPDLKEIGEGNPFQAPKSLGTEVGKIGESLGKKAEKAGVKAVSKAGEIDAEAGGPDDIAGDIAGGVVGLGIFLGGLFSAKHKSAVEQISNINPSYQAGLN